MAYQVIYYRDSKGIEPVNNTIDSLNACCQVSADWYINLLNRLDDKDPTLGDPDSSALKGRDYRGFRELRVECEHRHHRIIYRRSRRFWILLHMIPNKTIEIPEGDKALALARWRDFVDRMNSVPRANPRAMGHDAP